MSYRLLQALKTIKDIKKNNIPSVSHANINVLDSEIELDINGIPSIIIINYIGSVYFETLMNDSFRLHVGRNKIIITNMGRHEFPKDILSYGGELKIINCMIINFDKLSIIPTINNKQEESLLNEAKTNFEDNTLILYDSKKINYGRSSRGYSSKHTTRRRTTSRTSPARPSRPSRPTKRGGY